MCLQVDVNDKVSECCPSASHGILLLLGLETEGLFWRSATASVLRHVQHEFNNQCALIITELSCKRVSLAKMVECRFCILEA